mgnify:CR=1 FL=1
MVIEVALPDAIICQIRPTETREVSKHQTLAVLLGLTQRDRNPVRRPFDVALPLLRWNNSSSGTCMSVCGKEHSKI